jgi:hypothetical protein
MVNSTAPCTPSLVDLTIELDVQEVKRVAKMYDDAPPEIRTFLDTLRVRELCADWMKLRARHA